MKEKVKSSEVLEAPSEKQFTTLIRAVKGHEADKNEVLGGLGATIKNAIDKQHLDRKAFAIFRGLMRMSDKKLTTTLAHLDHYIEIGGLNARILSQPDMIGRDAELAETKVDAVEENGHRKKKNGAKGEKTTGVAAAAEAAAAAVQGKTGKAKKEKKGAKKKKGESADNVVTFDSQRDREGAAQFGEAVDGAVH